MILILKLIHHIRSEFKLALHGLQLTLTLTLTLRSECKLALHGLQLNFLRDTNHGIIDQNKFEAIKRFSLTQSRFSLTLTLTLTLTLV